VDQDFQVVVQVQTDGALRDQPLGPGHFHVLVVNHHVGSVQYDPHAFADQPDRDRVAVGADRDLAVTVDPRCEHPACLERFVGRRHQQWLIECVLLRDRLGPGSDAAGVVLPVPLFDLSFSSASEEASGTGTKWLRRK
jgi:hypothetical protein